MTIKTLYAGTDAITPHHHNGGTQRARAVVNELRRQDPQASIHSYSALFPNFKKRRKLSPKLRARWLGYRGPHYKILQFMSGRGARRAIAALRQDLTQCDENSTLVIDHPWAFLAIERELKAMQHPPKVIYSAHNVEHVYMRDSAPENRRRLAFKLTRAVELDLVQRADVVIATTDEDANYFQSQSPDTEVVRIGNGCDTGRFSQQYPEKFYFYIGSAHPPNLIGLETCLAGFDDSKGLTLLIAGNICDMLVEKNSFLANHENIRLLGRLPDLMLPELYHKCAGVIIPETSGSGSNIKCAEALMSGKSVVTTTHGMRGYETFLETEGVYSVSKPQEFIAMMQQAWPELAASKSYPRGDSLNWDKLFANRIPNLHGATESRSRRKSAA